MPAGLAVTGWKPRERLAAPFAETRDVQTCWSGARAAETGKEAQAILKRFTVFNTDQCDSLPAEIATVARPPPPGMIEPQVEVLIKAD